MTIYVHVTEQCAVDAKHHQVQDRLDSVYKAILVTQNLTGFTLFLPSPFLKKPLGRSYRLIAYRCHFGADALLLLLRVLPRGGSEYGEFLEAWDHDTDRVIADLVPYTKEQIRQLYLELRKKPPAPPLPPPSADEQAWLYDVFSHSRAGSGLLVLETETWVKKMHAEGDGDLLNAYWHLVERLGFGYGEASGVNTDWKFVADVDAGVGVLYVYRQDLSQLLLLEPVRGSQEPQQFVPAHLERLSRLDAAERQLGRVAARAYPDVMALEFDAWAAIQKDSEANRALSTEESELLDTIRSTGAGGDLGYPLFLNGPAGSGKSTMLQYLAADYLDFALRQAGAQPQDKRPIQPPLYMTSSPDLLEVARNTVRKLLTCHHERLAPNAHEPAAVEAILERSFVVYHKFLYSLLPAEHQAELPEAHYVNYSTFRRLWNERFALRPEARQFAPDLAWHAIRSYIKGIRFNPDDELDPDEYGELPRRRRSISQETFKKIFNTVWLSWYKPLCEEEGYWDDQDLAAHVLASSAAAHVDCPAIFCDEAQDFTPIELDIIFQLSLFGRRLLTPEELQRVPIVFAGDPLQTINPTGFRWESVQSDFRERFSAILDPRWQTSVDLSFKELHYNYRSSLEIVRFCNLIQLVRAVLLGDLYIHPQDAWWAGLPAGAVWCVADDEHTTQQIQQRPELVKLVNCEEGEESEFAAQDAILHALRDEAGGIYRNVLGPAHAKGLEFPLVVLWRFAKSAPKDFSRLLQGDDALGELEDRLPFEYFLNRLYVAASRAKDQLIIVDSPQLLEKFWSFATDPEAVARLAARTGDRDAWLQAISNLAHGREEDWNNRLIDARKQAQHFAEEGRQRRDPYLLRQAALAYHSVGETYEEGRCLALACELEGKLGEAGERYRALELPEDAFRCFWAVQDWRMACDLAEQHPELSARRESQAAQAMHREGAVEASFLDTLIVACKEKEWLRTVQKDSAWRSVLTTTAQRLARAAGNDALPWEEINAAFAGLNEVGIPIPDLHLAVLAYRAGDFERAVALWEKSGAAERGEHGNAYRRAKAFLASFPEKLAWLAELREYEAVLTLWAERGAEVSMSKLDAKVVHAVADAAFDAEDLPLALKMVAARSDQKRLAKLMQLALAHNDDGVLNAAAQEAARWLVRERRWAEAVAAAKNADFTPLYGFGAPEVQPQLEQRIQRSAVLWAVVRALAVSEALPLEPPNRQSIITEFLMETFADPARLSSIMGTDGTLVQYIGAAIERAGKIVEALNYYETLERNAAAPELRRFAAERLARNYEKHAEYFRKPGDEVQAYVRDRWAQAARERAGAVGRVLPDYPVLAQGPG